MPRQTGIVVENKFNKGLITEASGLNFPEQACTETYNCVFDYLGTASRRLGIDYELNFTNFTVDRASKALSSFIWENAGGDGNTRVYVNQIGTTLYFYSITAATITDPLSDQKLSSTIDVSSFVASGGSFTASKECDYAAGNGYLFVYHPDCEPFYCTYVAGTITAVSITVLQRDFVGIPEAGVSDNFQPPALSAEHTYNVQNQGWISKPDWNATSTTSNNTSTGAHTWTIQTGLTISGGQTVTILSTTGDSHTDITLSATVTSYNSGTGALVLNVLTTTNAGQTRTAWTFTHTGTAYVTTYQSTFGVYPSNAEQWWAYKSSTGAFAPSTTTLLANIPQAPAPKGHYTIQSFRQLRTTASSIASLTDITTTVRPKTGCWFAGRVWYAGIDAAFAATGDAPNTTWTESVYFSQIVERAEQFGYCYQQNDPTDERLPDLLPSDGGVLRIQGCGSIYKLFPIQNGILVFAANGVWFITGSQGIGFTANDYTITRISEIGSISGTSFVNVHGVPYFFNREGIFYLKMDQNGMDIAPLTYTTISSFYSAIPLISKQYARGSHNPLDFTIKWLYRSTNESTTTNRYEFDRILCFNLLTGAFYPWSITTTSNPCIHDVKFIKFPGGSTFQEGTFKYFTTYSTGGSYHTTFSEEYRDIYLDWTTENLSTNYSSYFITGYKIRGDAIRQQQNNWIRVYTNNGAASVFDFQSRWNFAISSATGNWSSRQRVIMDQEGDFAYRGRRLKIRGRGLAMQYKVSSVQGEPFDIIGWVAQDTANAGL